MSRKIVLITSLSAGLVVLVAAATYVLHTSAAFMWGALPEPSVKIFLEAEKESLQLLQHARDQYQLNPSLPFEPSDTVRFVYAPGEHVIVFPRLSKNAQVFAALSEQGWQPQRLGVLIIGAKANEGASARQSPRVLVQRGGRELAASIWERRPLRPVLLAALDPARVPGMPLHSRVIGVRRGNGFVFAAAFKEAPLTTWPTIEMPPESAPVASGISASVPGAVLQLLPQNLHEAWNSLFYSDLALTRTRPDIVGLLGSFEHVLIEKGAGEVTIGAKDRQQNFGASIGNVLSAERAHANPITAAFRLPDGTIGYEKRPGQPENVFPASPQENQCVLSQNLEKSLRLCQKAGGLFLTTEPSQTPGWELAPAGSWRLHLGPEFASRLEASVAAIAAWGDDKQAHLVIQTFPAP